jgi:hypothetical protein
MSRGGLSHRQLPEWLCRADGFLFDLARIIHAATDVVSIGGT